VGGVSAYHRRAKKRAEGGGSEVVRCRRRFARWIGDGSGMLMRLIVDVYGGRAANLTFHSRVLFDVVLFSCRSGRLRGLA
jgi:hypothetical protein